MIQKWAEHTRLQKRLEVFEMFRFRSRPFSFSTHNNVPQSSILSSIMVKVGDQFRCENITVKTIQGTKFSKGIFTLLDLGPPRSIWSGNLSNKSCILVRDSTDLEGWIDAEDFIEDHGSAMGGSREWLSLDQLEAAREAEKMALKKHLQSITAAILSSPSMAHRTQSVQLPLLSLPSFSMSRPKTSAAGAGKLQCKADASHTIIFR